MTLCAFGSVISGILTKWFNSTRLETRTKESNMYASTRVENLVRNESECDGRGRHTRCTIDRP